MRTTVTLLFFLFFYAHTTGQNIYRTACRGNLARLDSMLQKTSIHAKDNRGRSLLHWAVACKKRNIFNFLTQKGIHIDEIDHQKRTPLHVAVQFNNAEYTDLLINLQTGTSWINDHGASLLELAILNKNKVLIQKLISAGIDINVVNNRGSTPLEISNRIGAKDLSEFILSLGADKSLVRAFRHEGKYMGLTPPGLQPKMFAPNFISTEEE